MRYKIKPGQGEYGDPGIFCGKCGTHSYNPNDVEQRYCPHCHVFHDDELQREFAAALHELETLPPVRLELQASIAWMVFGNLQLAWRHPANTGASREFVEEFARRLQALIAPGGALAEMAEKGWREEFDE